LISKENTGLIPSVDWRRLEGGEAHEQPEVAKQNSTPDLTNAVGEGLNRIVKIVKNRASGYRNLDAFADMIYLTVGDMDISAHIPSDLRTL